MELSALSPDLNAQGTEQGRRITERVIVFTSRAPVREAEVEIEAIARRYYDIVFWSTQQYETWLRATK